MKSICTDNPGIGNLLRNDLVYVDKTDILLKLITDWNGYEIARTRLDASDLAHVPLATLLYQTGYLTLQETFDDGMVSLKVPNYEVLDSLNLGSMGDWLGENVDGTVAAAKRTRRAAMPTPIATMSDRCG